jgi:steroid delta-isomerase-like uncharacterized protein
MSTEMSTTRTDRNKQLVDTFVQELFTHGDLDAVERHTTPDFVHHDPPFGGVPEGREGLRAMGTMIRAAVPDWHSDLELLVAEGDHVAERFTASGTHRGELLGVAPTGKTLVLPGINIFRIEGDRIAEMWSRLDTLGLLRQLGLA